MTDHPEDIQRRRQTHPAEPAPVVDTSSGNRLTLFVPVSVLVRSPGDVPPWRVRLAQRHGDPHLLGGDWQPAPVAGLAPAGLARAIVQFTSRALDSVAAASDQRRADEADRAAAYAVEPALVCPPASASLLQALVAAVLGEPVQAVELVQSVGRCHLVRYQPFYQPDPDLVVAVDPAAGQFHRAVAAFQRTRLTGQPRDPGAWYRRTSRQADRVLDALADLEPHSLEADFVAAWAYRVCASGGWA